MNMAATDACLRRALSASLRGRQVWLLVLLAGFITSSACGQDESPFTRLFDTGTASADRLVDELVAKRTGWRLVDEDNLTHKFAGDAVLLNDKLAVVLRKQSSSVEVYSKSVNGLKHRASVGHLGTRSTANDPIGSIRILENTIPIGAHSPH